MRGCVYTPPLSPGYVHTKLDNRGSPFVNDFNCNHAMDMYQFTLSFYKLIFNNYLIYDTLIFKSYDGQDLKTFSGNLINFEILQ